MTTIVIDTFLIVAQIFAVFLAVDLVSGILHWLEDSYGKASWPLVGKHVIKPNINHHFYPRAFTKTSFLQRNSVTLALSATVLLIVTLCGALHWMWILAALIGGISNEIHCWAHRSSRENGHLISFLQKTGLLQSARAHARHHTDPKNCSYCTVTNFMNPFLDHLGFWEKAERVIAKVFGVDRRVDESVRTHRSPKQPSQCSCSRSTSGKDCAQCTHCTVRDKQPELAS